MKTIAIKLPEEAAKELDKFIKNHHYNSKSEFIRKIIMEEMETKLSEESIKAINKSIEEIKQGKTISLEEMEKKYGLSD